MQTLALYNNGELLDRADRQSIQAMRKLGFPRDYIGFLARYGAGEFANPLLSLYTPGSILRELLQADLTLAIKEPVQVGGFHGGQVMAVLHVDRVLFEYWPRDETEDRPVFIDLEKMLSGLDDGNADDLTAKRVYDQVFIPSCFFSSSAPADAPPKDNDPVFKAILSLGDPGDFTILRYPEGVEMINEKLGFSVVFNRSVSAVLKFRYEARLGKLIEVLAAHNWTQNKPPETLDFYLINLEK